MIPVYQPFVSANQKNYVNECLDSNWISSQGKFISQFEETIANFIGVKHAISTFNGSVSLQLILAGLGIGTGDEVIVPSLTYAATISTIMWAGATPVLVDSIETMQMNISQVAPAITKKTKAVMVPQLYGDAPDMDKLVSICANNNIYLIEDSAEAFGCKNEAKKIGSYGVASSFSFFGNKTITTGEGGVVCTNDDQLAKRMRLLKSQSHIGNFMHDGPGFNFRMTNIQAAIGCAQMEHIEEIIAKKKALAAYLRANLHSDITRIVPSIDSAEWMPLFLLPAYISYPRFMSMMKDEGVDTRPAFCPTHLMSGFKYYAPVSFPISSEIYKRGFNLPSYPDLTQEQLEKICQAVNSVLSKI